MSDPNYDEIRKRVQERFNKQKELSIHAMVYTVINLLIWGSWFVGSITDFPVITGIFEGIGFLPPLIVSIGWGIGLVAHVLDYYYSVGGGARRRERVIQREIEQEMERRAAYEKPKRDRLTLTEDSEFEEVADEDYNRAGKRRR